MRYCPLILVVCLLIVLLSGCARYPAPGTGNLAPARTLLSTVTVLSNINPSYYYFLAIDTTPNSTNGPIPIVTGSEFGNGWGILSGLGPNDPVVGPPYFVMYHDGTFSSFRFDAALNQYVYLGQPFRGELTAPNQLLVEIDQSTLVTAGSAIPDNVRLNWFTDEMIVTPPQLIGVTKQYDGIGPLGDKYLQIQLGVTQTIESGIGTAPEELPHDTTNIDAIDMTAYTVETRLQNAP